MGYCVCRSALLEHVSAEEGHPSYLGMPRRVHDIVECKCAFTLTDIRYARLIFMQNICARMRRWTPPSLRSPEGVRRRRVKEDEGARGAFASLILLMCGCGFLHHILSAATLLSYWTGDNIQLGELAASPYKDKPNPSQLRVSEYRSSAQF